MDTTRSATRQILPNRRESLTQKIRVGNRRTVWGTHRMPFRLRLPSDRCKWTRFWIKNSRLEPTILGLCTGDDDGHPWVSIATLLQHCGM